MLQYQVADTAVTLCNKLRKLSQSHKRLQVWALLGQQARPLLDRVPALRTPLGYVERWFCNPR